MSLSVGGYGQGYPHPGPMAHHHPHHHPHHPHPAAEFYPHQYPQQMRYGDHPDPASATAAAAAAAAAAAYFPSWMLSPGEEHLPIRVEGGGYPLGSPSEYTSFIQYENGIPVRCIKRRVTANKKERRRTLSINNAFAQLRGCIPNVPSDTKLSKIKTLRLATSYIAYLMDLLDKDNPADLPECFKAEITKKPSPGVGGGGGGGGAASTGSSASSFSSSSSSTSSLSSASSVSALCHQGSSLEGEKRKRESDGDCPDDSSCSPTAEKRTKGRTGWPQHVWAAELKQ